MKPLFLLGAGIFWILHATAQVRTPKETNTSKMVVNKAVLSGPARDSVVTDISNMFKQMEQNIEQEFAKLKKAVKDNIDALNGKIKDIDQQVKDLKEQSYKLGKQLQKIDELLPYFQYRLDSVKNNPNKSLTPEMVLKSIDSLIKAEKLATDQIKQNDTQIQMNLQQKKNLQNQIKQLEAQLVTLEKQKQKMLNDLEKQKQKSMQEAMKNKEQSPQNYQEGLNTIRLRNTRIVNDSLLHARSRFGTRG